MSFRFPARSSIYLSLVIFLARSSPHSSLSLFSHPLRLSLSPTDTRHLVRHMQTNNSNPIFNKKKTTSLVVCLRIDDGNTLGCSIHFFWIHINSLLYEYRPCRLRRNGTKLACTYVKITFKENAPVSWSAIETFRQQPLLNHSKHLNSISFIKTNYSSSAPVTIIFLVVKIKMPRKDRRRGPIDSSRYTNSRWSLGNSSRIALYIYAPKRNAAQQSITYNVVETAFWGRGGLIMLTSCTVEHALALSYCCMQGPEHTDKV